MKFIVIPGLILYVTQFRTDTHSERYEGYIIVIQENFTLVIYYYDKACCSTINYPVFLVLKDCSIEILYMYNIV